MKSLQQLIRRNILALKPYTCARNEFNGEASIFIDANENPYNNNYNRYPDPLQIVLKERIAKIKGVRPTQIMLGNGSDEPIDLIYRIFCEPTIDNVVAIAPTYGMYGVCADINNVEYREVLLNSDFDIDAEQILAKTDNNTKVIWLCSPNNPTGNLLNSNEITKVLDSFDGITIIDEAYIDFANSTSWLNSLDKYPNLIVLQTFSKAWGMAAVRCGMAFASEEIINIFNNVKYPYNINKLTQEFVYKQIEDEDYKNISVKKILEQRQNLSQELKNIECVEHVYPSDANAILVKVKDACATYKTLMDKGIIVRNRHTVTMCCNCLRITIGTDKEMSILIEELKKIK